MDKIAKFATGKRVLIFVILANIVYVVMIIITIPLVVEFSGGMRLLDMMPTGYSLAYVHTLLETLGEEGRHNYLVKQIPLDMIYPLLFGIAYALLLAFLMNRIGWPRKVFFLVHCRWLLDFLTTWRIFLLFICSSITPRHKDSC